MYLIQGALRWVCIFVCCATLCFSAAWGQNSNNELPEVKWRFYTDVRGYLETPTPNALFDTPAEACIAGSDYVLSRYRPDTTLNSTRPLGLVTYSSQFGQLTSFNGHKCAINDLFGGIGGDDIVENGVNLSEPTFDENGFFAGRGIVWWGRIAAIPFCPENSQDALVDGSVACGLVVDKAAPDCEGVDGDSLKSTPPKKCAGNPIAIDSGAKQHQDTDYATADGLMSVRRKYRSNSRPGNLSKTLTEIPGFGTNWRGLLPGRITLKQDYSWTAEFLNDEGGVRRYSIYDNGAGDTVIEATGVPTRLTLSFTQMLAGSIDDFVGAAASNNGSGDLRLAYANGDYIVFRRSGDFDPQSKTRNFVPIEHGLANGYKRWFDYPDTGQYPNKIRDNLGREMAIDWTEIGWASNSLRGYYKAPNQPAGSAGMTLEKAVSAIALPDGTRLAYAYGASSASGFLGRLETVQRFDASNNVLWGRTYLYEDTRFKTAMTGILDQNGARLSTYSYNENRQTISTQRAGGFDHQQVNYSVGPESPENYDRPVDIREVTNPLGLMTRHTYSAYSESYSSGESPGPDPRFTPRRLLRRESQATSSVPATIRTHEYDEDGLKIAQTDANGQRSTQENIAGEGRPSFVTDAAGVETQITWHPTLDLRTRTVRKQLQTDYSYDANGHLIGISETDLDTGIVRGQQFSMGAAGRVEAINGPRAPDALGRDDITTMTYDVQGNRLTMTNPLGHVIRYEGYDANGRPARMIDANGIATDFTYDGLGRVKTTTVKHPTDLTRDATTTLDYDVEGRVTAITRPDTVALRFDYNLAGLMTAMHSDDGERIDYTHDLMGNVLSETVKRADATQARSIVRTFDEIGRLLTLTLGPDRTTRFQYDNVGNATKITSARGHAVDQAFDALNRVVSTLAPDGGKTGYGYAGGVLAATGGGTADEPITSGNGDNPANELGAFRDPNGVTTRFTRNAFGEVTEEVSPDRGTTLYEYDLAGDVTAMVDGRGQRVEYTRDILGRVTVKTPVGRPLSERVIYSYDTASITGSYGIGRLGRIDDGSGATRFGYDHRGNLVTRYQKLVGTPDWVALRYAYDLADRIELVTYPSGRQVRYVRDMKGRVQAVRTRANNSIAAWTNVASAMGYEAFGSLKTMSLGNGERLVTTYGDDGRMDGRRLYRQADGTNISHLTYGYDADDNIIRITDRLDATQSQNFAYDAAGRLVRVTTASGDMRRTDYVFDDNGNRTKKLTRALPEDPASAAVTERYALAAGTNRLASITAPSGNHSYTHDARGNLASETRPGGVNVATAYDGYGRLTSYTRTGEASLTHIYNGMDDRVATTAGSTTRRFVYAPDGRVLGEYGNSASDVKVEYIWMNPEVGEASASLFGGDDGLNGYMPLAVAANDNSGASQLTWVHANHMGVPVRYSDAAGVTTTQGDWQAPGFPGQSRTLPDLYYNRYRDYDSSTGRYIQADPIGLTGGPSPYSYALNSPLRYSDPRGEWVPVACAVGALVGGAGTAIGEYLTADENYNWRTATKHALVGAGAGCVSAVTAPFAATSVAGAIALGAATNAGQYAVTKYWDDDCITAEGLLLNAALGGIAGMFAGRFEPRGKEWIEDALPWMARGTRDLHRGLNQARIEDAARRGLFGSVASGTATTILGSPF